MHIERVAWWLLMPPEFDPATPARDAPELSSMSAAAFASLPLLVLVIIAIIASAAGDARPDVHLDEYSYAKGAAAWLLLYALWRIVRALEALAAVISTR